MTKTRWFQGVAIVFVIGILTIFFINLRIQADVVEVGDKAIDFELKGLHGDSYQLSDYNGKPIVLYFFTTWCTSCKKQTPEMIEFQEEFADEVHVLTIVRSESKRAVEKYIEETGHSENEYLFDFKLEVSDNYGIVGQPETIIIDKEGIVADHIIGPLAKDELASRVKSFIN